MIRVKFSAPSIYLSHSLFQPETWPGSAVLCFRKLQAFTFCCEQQSGAAERENNKMQQQNAGYKSA
jgi:hypothetical protein